MTSGILQRFRKRVNAAMTAKHFRIFAAEKNGLLNTQTGVFPGLDSACDESWKLSNVTNIALGKPH